ncbi:unnamed protein product [Amaranthus hypochondriacus]
MNWASVVKVAGVQSEVDDLGFRPVKKTYRPKPQAKPIEVEGQGKAAEPPPPKKILDDSVPLDVEQQVSALPSDGLMPSVETQSCTEVVKLQIPRLILRQKHVLPISNGFGVLSLAQGDDSNNVALGADPIQEHD